MNKKRSTAPKYKEISIATMYTYTIVSNRLKMTYIFTEKTDDMPLQFKMEQCIYTNRCFLYENEIMEEMTFMEAINRIHPRALMQAMSQAQLDYEYELAYNDSSRKKFIAGLENRIRNRQAMWGVG